MRYGRTLEDGFLPVFSVGSEEEARRLLTMACPLSNDGEFLAPELVADQTIKNLDSFSQRLEELHKMIPSEWCDCNE